MNSSSSHLFRSPRAGEEMGGAGAFDSARKESKSCAPSSAFAKITIPLDSDSWMRWAVEKIRTEMACAGLLDWQIRA
jgi:hypothetical protein